MQGPYHLAPSITFHLPIYITLALSRLPRLYLIALFLLIPFLLHSSISFAPAGAAAAAAIATAPRRADAAAVAIATSPLSGLGAVIFCINLFLFGFFVPLIYSDECGEPFIESS